jgi:uncharacterized protein (TIGR02598 family)
MNRRDNRAQVHQSTSASVTRIENKMERILPTTNHQPPTTKKGFTLIEIITALAIMVIGLLSILALFPVGFHASKRAADFTKVALFAQEKLEEVKMKGFDNVDSFNGQSETEGIFSRQVTISQVTGYDNLKEITVKVTWTERGQTREEEFKTYIADYTP